MLPASGCQLLAFGFQLLVFGISFVSLCALRVLCGEKVFACQKLRAGS